MNGPLPSIHDLIIYFLLYLAQHKATLVAFGGLGMVAMASAIPDPHNPEDWGDPGHQCSTFYIFFHKSISNFLGMTGRNNRYSSPAKSTYVLPPPAPASAMPTNLNSQKQEIRP